ncbi:TetR/AcrR family transcriptional regulator [Acinetobacter pittii]|uniref:TetR/AcrR family transcriptional regulator n=1 Tax=Acinetobacter pittii TaxID=48296 RepID=UPI0018FF1DCC|nr:TetR/AcrR family transcriptional regulator [Acinetobacter pittii]MBJ9935599.1 helix-turn-helix transcriptional regulator [Acinetobacter pittii]
MPNLEASFRALSVLHAAKDLFNQNGFYIGIDRIIEEAKIPKATFYNYFQSKEKFIELCLNFQKDLLKEKVRGVIETSKYSTLAHKLRQIYLLHADLNSAYYLLFKAIFEIKTIYPNAYQTAIRYRRWLKNEIFCLLMETNKSVSYAEAEIFVFMIDGAILDLLGSDQVMQRGALLEYFLKRV